MKKKIVLSLFGLLVFGVLFVSCDTGNGTPDVVPTFVAVTSITCPQTIAIVGQDLTLSGIVEPSNATNKNIVWNGVECVNNGVLTATSEKTYTVTATIENGTSESSPYTKDFSIKAYDTDSDNVQENPFFGKRWQMSGTNFGYDWTGTGTFTDSDFDVVVPNMGRVLKGTYTWNGTGAEWIVTESTIDGFVVVGDNGIMILLPDNKMLSANCNDHNLQGIFDLVQE